MELICFFRNIFLVIKSLFSINNIVTTLTCISSIATVYMLYVTVFEKKLIANKIIVKKSLTDGFRIALVISNNGLRGVYVNNIDIIFENEYKFNIFKDKNNQKYLYVEGMKKIEVTSDKYSKLIMSDKVYNEFGSLESYLNNVILNNRFHIEITIDDKIKICYINRNKKYIAGKNNSIIMKLKLIYHNCVDFIKYKKIIKKPEYKKINMIVNKINDIVIQENFKYLIIILKDNQVIEELIVDVNGNIINGSLFGINNFPTEYICDYEVFVDFFRHFVKEYDKEGVFNFCIENIELENGFLKNN